MIADPTISVAGHAVSAFQLLTTGALLLCAAAIMLAYRRELKFTVRRSPATDEIYDQLVRVANALERIASQAPDSTIADASRRADRAAAGEREGEQVREERHVAYSMFGR